MDAPLWTETHAPTLSELPQEDAREYLQRAVEEPINLILHGPPGSGKTAAARALAREAHGVSASSDSDDSDPDRTSSGGGPDTDLVEINVADFFNRTKKEIRSDPRFAHFLQGQTEFSKQYRRGSDQRNKYKREWSKRDMIAHVLKEQAGYAPSSGTYKTILLDNTEAIREDFQHALRRIMEQHHRTTQFVIATRQPSKLIPPIRSRCFPVSMRAPSSDETVAVLERIVEREGVDADADGLEFIAGYANGNLRQAILAAQTTALEEGEITMQTAYETIGAVGLDEEIESMLEDAEAGEFTDARKTLDDLLVDEGLSGSEVLESLLSVARKRYQGDQLARIHRLAADVEFEMNEGTSDRIHVSRVLAELGREA